MIQRHRILFNPRFSANTSAISSNLITVGGYQVNNVQGIGGGIVNASNVRNFLNDDVNEFIINDFFSYLTGSTTTVEFSEIYHSDQKLADVFNEYYVSSVLNNQIPSTSVINESLAGTSGITVVENSYYNVDGIAPYTDLKYIPLSINNSTRILNVYSALTTYTLEQSYYIPVFIKRNSKQMARLNFKDEVEIINLILNSTTLSQEEVPVDVGDLFTPVGEYLGGTYSSYGSYGNSNSNTAQPPADSEAAPTAQPPADSEAAPTAQPPADSGTAPSEPSIFERFLK